MRPNTQHGVTLMELLISITLLSLLSVGMLFAMRVGLNSMGKTNEHVANDRRVLGVERIITEQIAGFVPAAGLCASAPEAPPARIPFFQGEPQTMRFISTYSLQEAARGYPRILEFQVAPDATGQGVRLLVNERLYTHPLSTAPLCAGVQPDPQTGAPTAMWRPVVTGSQSYVLMDKLARCQFSFKEERDPALPDLWYPRWPKDFTPNAVRIDMVPLEYDPARLQVPPIVAPFRVTRHAFSQYSDAE